MEIVENGQKVFVVPFYESHEIVKDARLLIERFRL